MIPLYGLNLNTRYFNGVCAYAYGCGWGGLLRRSYDQRSPPLVSKKLLTGSTPAPNRRGSSVFSCGWDPGPSAVVF